MNTELTEENYLALSRYRQERAHETISEIPFLCEQGFYNTAINRMYYACYYATEALLLKDHIQAQTHSGVKTMLAMHFVSTGKIPVAIGKTLSTLYEKRQSSDYDDFVYCNQTDVDELTVKAVEFIQTIEILIK